ncbi:hypothetical protein N9D03_01270 [Alphaproteobacteria bacterium]|nr:hypothetical protein [Alphaproteobacteria bacterium]
MTGNASNDTVDVAGLTVTGTYNLAGGSDVISALNGAHIGGATISNTGTGRYSVDIADGATITMSVDHNNDASDITGAGGTEQVTMSNNTSVAKGFNTTTGMNADSDNKIDITAHNFSDGDAVVYTKVGNQNIGLVDGTTYYVRAATANDFELATAVGGGAIVLQAAGGNQTHTLSASYTTFAAADVTTGTDTIVDGQHGFTTGDAVTYTVPAGGTVLGGLTSGTVYYVIRADADSYKLASSYANAVAGTAIDITNQQIGQITKTIAAHNNVETYALAAGMNTILINASDLDTNVTGSANNDTVDVAGLTVTGTYALAGGTDNAISAKNGANISGATITNAGDGNRYSVKLADGAAVTMTHDQNNIAKDITGAGGTESVTVTDATGAAMSFNGGAGGVATDTDTITTTTDHGFVTGDAVTYRLPDSGTVPTGLTSGTVYYVVKTGADTLKLATSYDNAVAGTPSVVNITGAGATNGHVLSKTVVAHDNVETYVLAAGTNEIRINANDTDTNVTGGSGADTVDVAGLTVTGTYSLAAGANAIVAANGAAMQGATISTVGGTYSVNLAGGASVTMTDDHNNTATDITGASGTEQITISNATGAATTINGSSGSVVILADDRIAETSHGYATGDAVVYRATAGSNPITGLTSGTVYYVISNTANLFSLASSAANAVEGTQIDLTGLGTGTTHTIAKAVVAHDNIETYVLADGTNEIRLHSSGDGASVTGGTGADTVSISASNVVTGTYALAAGSNIVDLANGVELQGATITATGGTYAINMADGATTKMTVVQHNSATDITGVGATEEIQITDNMQKAVFNAAGVDAGNDQLDTVANHGFVTGDAVMYRIPAGGTAVGGLSTDTTYYVIRIDDNTLKFATTYANAIAGTATALSVGVAGDGHTLDEVIVAADKVEKYTLADGGQSEIVVNSATLGVNVDGGTGNDTVNVAGLDVSGTYALAAGTNEIIAKTGAEIDGATITTSAGATYSIHIADGSSVKMKVAQHNSASDITGAGATETLTLADAAGANKTFNGSDSGAVNVAGDTITISSHGFSTGDAVTYAGELAGTAIGGLTDGTTYYVIKSDDNSFKLATSHANATAGTPTAVTISSLGTLSDHQLMPVLKLDADIENVTLANGVNRITASANDQNITSDGGTLYIDLADRELGTLTESSATTTTLDISGTTSLLKLDGVNLSTVETLRLGADQANGTTDWTNFDWDGAGVAANITTFSGKLIVEGRTGDQTITGTGGADEFHGGTGSDTITGGNGIDTYFFDSTPTANDFIITDFTLGTGGDVLDLSMFNLIRVAANGSTETTTIDFENYPLSFQSHGGADDTSTILAFSTLQQDTTANLATALQNATGGMGEGSELIFITADTGNDQINIFHWNDSAVADGGAIEESEMTLIGSLTGFTNDADNQIANTLHSDNFTL